MNLTLKEALGIAVAIVASAMVLAAFFKFGLFGAMVQLIEGVV